MTLNLMPARAYMRRALTQRIEVLKESLTGAELTGFNRCAPYGLDKLSEDELISLYELTCRTLRAKCGGTTE